jgi:hypothetical protein
MTNSKKLYYYAIISLLLCIMLSYVLFTEFNKLKNAEYSSLSTQFGLAEAFLAVIFVTGLSLFFRRDKFLKLRTIFIYIFCGVLNLSFSIVYFLFSNTISDNKFLAIYFGILLLLIGIYITWSVIKGSKNR